MRPALARVLTLLGLVSLGEGLFILTRIVPHESPLLGAALAAGGALFLYLSPPPRIERFPRWPTLASGLLLAAGVIAYNTARGATYAAPKLALIAFGLWLASLAPFTARPRIATTLAWSIPVVGFPLAAWVLQAALKTSIGGVTPVETFVSFALLVPMSRVLDLLGYAPSVAGQIITFATPRGPMRLNVGVACSGIQAMGLFGGLLMIYVAAERPPVGRAALWYAVGLAGVYLANLVRLVTLAIVGSAWGSGALLWTHANLGWMFFVAWTALFALWTTRTAAPRTSLDRRHARAAVRRDAD